MMIDCVAGAAATLGAVAAEPKEAARSQNSSFGPYPQPPWEWHTDTLMIFLGTHPINGSYPPDDVPDPAITYVSQPYPSAFTIARYRQAPWGDWDQARP